jgi:hypothetical protein
MTGNISEWDSYVIGSNHHPQPCHLCIFTGYRINLNIDIFLNFVYIFRNTRNDYNSYGGGMGGMGGMGMPGMGAGIPGNHHIPYIHYSVYRNFF